MAGEVIETIDSGGKIRSLKEWHVPEGGATGQHLIKTGPETGAYGWSDPAAPGGGTPSDTVASETSFGVNPSAGVAEAFSRGDHTHGTPVNPVAAHEAASDPHTQYSTNADLVAHEGAADPHAAYQRESEKGQPNGYPSLDGAGTIPDAQIPAAIARDSEVSSAVAAHAAAGDPHAAYLLEVDHTKAAHDALLIDAATLDGVDSTGFAVAAKGVTNGDSHDHAGGDGAQIAYGSLSGLPTVPAPANAGETADSTTGAESDGTSPRYAKADHVHHYEAGAPGSHAATHQNGGGDEISVAGLSGVLADPQTPAAHAAAHQPGGGDAMAVDAVAATGSLRTLGSGAQQAAAGDHTHAGSSPYLLVPLHVPLAGNSAWTNMPVALSFFGSTNVVLRTVYRLDLSGFTQVRFRMWKPAVAGAAAAKVILRYKAPPVTQTVADFLDIGVSEVSWAINVTNTYLDTGWINLVAGAKADVFVAPVASGGDAALDPQFGPMTMEFK